MRNNGLFCCPAKALCWLTKLMLCWISNSTEYRWWLPVPPLAPCVCHWFTWQAAGSGASSHSGVTAGSDATVTSHERPGGEGHQTCTSQCGHCYWQGPTEAEMKPANLTWHLADLHRGKHQKVLTESETQQFSETQDHTHDGFNDLLLSLALLFSETSLFKTIYTKYVVVQRLHLCQTIKTLQSDNLTHF